MLAGTLFYDRTTLLTMQSHSPHCYSMQVIPW